ncbi:MAG: PEGA domain-containing protein [Paludibacteraceae bacterium]
MRNGIIKYLLSMMLASMAAGVFAQYKVEVVDFKFDPTDRSQVNSPIKDQNGETCALLIVESPIADLLQFDLGSLGIERREDKDEETWIWVSPDATKMTIACDGCTKYRDYRMTLTKGSVYRMKVKTGLPKEISQKQNLQIYCINVPFTVSIDGAMPDTSRNALYIKEGLDVGSHTISVSASFCKTYEGMVKLKRSVVRRDTLTLEPWFGFVNVSSNVEGVSVFVDGALQTGNPPYKLSPGVHKLMVEKKLYKTFETEIEIVHNQTKPVTVRMEPTFITMQITSKEKETEIWVDGALVAIQKAKVDLEYGMHTIQGRLNGCETWQWEQNVTSKTPTALTIPELVKQYGKVKISVTPADAEVTLNGRLLNGKNGWYEENLLVGNYLIVVRKEDCKTLSEQIQIEKDQYQFKALDLEKVRIGVVTIRTDQGVSINVRDMDTVIYKGSTEWTGRLPIGPNVIVLKNPNGLTLERTIFVNEKHNRKQHIPFYRPLTVKTNSPKVTLQMKDSNGVNYEIKRNKITKLEPRIYTITATQGQNSEDKKVDLIKQREAVVRFDLSSSRSSRSYHYHNRYLRGSSRSSSSLSHSSGSSSRSYTSSVSSSSNGTSKSSTASSSASKTERTSRSTASKPTRTSSSGSGENVFQRFYNESGTKFVGIASAGYIYSLADGAQWLSVGVLPFRYKMFGMNLLDMEVSITPMMAEYFIYKPTMRFYFPVSKNFALTAYAGACVDLTVPVEKYLLQETPTYDFYCGLVGGVSMWFNFLPKIPMDVFAEYRYPLINDMQTQGFYFGVSFLLGVDR